jgi:hypothetical protein
VNFEIEKLKGPQLKEILDSYNYVKSNSRDKANKIIYDELAVFMIEKLNKLLSSNIHA